MLFCGGIYADQDAAVHDWIGKRVGSSCGSKAHTRRAKLHSNDSEALLGTITPSISNHSRRCTVVVQSLCDDMYDMM